MGVRHATPEEKRVRDTLAHQAWGQRLSVGQFVQREERLRAHPWAAQAMVTWLLEDRGHVISSCETFCMRSWHNGRYGNTYAVASVFTEPHLRGRGYAVGMLDEVMKTLTAQDPQALASVLYSDVGENIYNRCGYASAGAPFDWEAPALPGTRLDATLLDEQRMGEALRLQDRSALFGVEVSLGQLDWQVERERAYASLLDRMRPESHGALHADAAATWCASLKEDELLVLSLDARTGRGLQSVLAAAQDAAARVGLPVVRVWETGALRALGRPIGWKRVPRDGSLPMLRPIHAPADACAWTEVPRALWV